MEELNMNVLISVLFSFYSGNHERDWPNSGSFYSNIDSGGECGVLAQTMFYVPAENRAKFWYSKQILYDLVVHASQY